MNSDDMPDEIDTVSGQEYEAEMARRKRAIDDDRAFDYWYGQRYDDALWAQEEAKR